MGYNPVPDEQWTRDDLAAAEAANDHKAIDAARRAGHLNTLLTPEPAEASDPERVAEVLAVGPTVPGQMPGSVQATSSTAPMDRAELDALAAAGDYAAINQARRDGRLKNLGA